MVEKVTRNKQKVIGNEQKVTRNEQKLTSNQPEVQPHAIYSTKRRETLSQFFILDQTIIINLS